MPEIRTVATLKHKHDEIAASNEKKQDEALADLLAKAIGHRLVHLLRMQEMKGVAAQIVSRPSAVVDSGKGVVSLGRLSADCKQGLSG